MKKVYGFIFVIVGLVLAACGQPSTADEPSNVRVPVVLDGVTYQPEDMAQFEGQSLQYVLTPQAVEEGVIYAFSSPEKSEAFMKTAEPSIQQFEQSELRTQAPLTYSKFYDHSYYSIFFGKLKKGQSISNLAGHPDYNNNDITSVKCRTGAYTYLWDNTGFGGSGFYCRAVNIPHLNAYGWDNRASSLEVTP